MSGARVFTFDPETEFVVLEEAIEVDETIQRPEAVRFFTLEEQTTDAYELMIPKGRVSRFQREEVRNIVDRMKELYEDSVLTLPDDYALREPERGLNLPWVHPVYADVELKSYDVETSWLPLFAEETRRAPGYYPRLIAALPKPYQTTGGTQHEVTEPTEFVNAGGEKRLRVLPVYTATKTIEHEDKTREIAPRPMLGSEDVVNRLGYYLDKRPLELPNPLADHPFLKANEATFVESTAPLKDVVPSLDAVLTHAVPVTNDPYGEGAPFLKLYDVKLSSIPWSSWKSRFPPVEVEQTPREKIEIPFPKPEELAPSAKILEAYKTTYAPGVSVREWLMRQDDGGEFVIKALLSKAIDNGSVESIPGVDLPVPEPPASSLEECALTNLSFPDFLVKGLLRYVPEEKKRKAKIFCVPLEHVRQERARAGYLNRKPWKESTENDIKVAQLTALRSARRQEAEVPVLAEQRTPGKPESAHRRDTLAILHDVRRHTLDKLQDLKEVVKDDLLSENVYRDADGQFVLCQHTLSVLSGDLEKDRAFFYDVWTTPVEGWRVCKFCGERIGDEDFFDQDEYDVDGRRTNRKESLETPQVFLGETVKLFTAGLQKIRGLFQMEDPADATMFQLLSLLQVLPEGDTVDFFLKQGRAMAAKTKKAQAMSDAGMEARGLVGIALTALLLQCHIPFLEPRRSFWSKPMTFAGYPRDERKPEDFGVVDILMMVFENTYRGFPMALSGPLKQIVRAVLTKPYDKPTDEKKKGVRTLVLRLLETQFLPNPEIQAALQRARQVLKTLPAQPPIVPFLPIRPPERKEAGYPKCPGVQSILAGKNAPKIRQPIVPLRSGIHASSSREAVVPTVSQRTEVMETPRDQIRRRLALKGVAAKDTWHTNLLLASRFASLQRKPLDIAAVAPTQSASLLRDIAKGFVNEASQGYEADPSKDVTLFCLLADYDKARSEARKIRDTERITYTQRMAEFTDLEREVNMELAKRGMAPTIIGLAERIELGRSVDLSDLMDVGVGEPQLGDAEEQATEVYANAGADAGDYGNLAPLPFREGRDPYEATLLDDPSRSI
jgi:hypothetical protein